MIKGNEPVTPIYNTRNDAVDDKGLTKREYFAAMALQGFLANTSGTILNPEFVAKHSVAYADALINALNETK